MKRRKGTILILLGVLLILAAGGLTGYNLWTDRRGEESAGLALADIRARMPEPRDAREAEENAEAARTGVEEYDVPPWVLDPDRELPVTLANGRRYVGTLAIPSLGLELPVAAGWSYDDLKVSPCCYAGTPYQQNMVICGHNYRSHLGPLSRLPKGAEVCFTDGEGYAFRYAVASVEVLQPTAVEDMVDSEYPLSLFTCTLGGKTRLTVRCEAAA